MDAIFDFIDDRFRARADESLADLAQDVPLHASSLVAQAHWIFDHRDRFLRFVRAPGRVAALATFTVERVKRFVYARNPYLDLGAKARRALRARYRAYYERIAALTAAADSVEALADALVDLTVANLARVGQLLQEQAWAYGGSREAQAAYYATLTAGEYSAATQETIVSHQAFSTHFLFHHTHSEEQALAMAERMMAILRGLRMGGTFVYTPGLPFIEPLLAETGRYAVESFRAGDVPEVVREIAYATHIVRVADDN